MNSLEVNVFGLFLIQPLQQFQITWTLINCVLDPDLFGHQDPKKKT